MLAREAFAQKRTEIYQFLKDTKDESWKTRTKKFRSWSAQRLGASYSFSTLYNEARRAGWWPEPIRAYRARVGTVLAANKKPEFIKQYDPRKNQLATIKAVVNLDLPSEVIVSILKQTLNG